MLTPTIHSTLDATYHISQAEAVRVEAFLFKPRAQIDVPAMGTSRAGALIGLVGIFGLIACGLFLPCSVAAVILGLIGRHRDGRSAHRLWMLALISGSVGVGITGLGAFLASEQFVQRC